MSSGSYNTGLSIYPKMAGIFFFWKFFNRPSVSINGNQTGLNWNPTFVPCNPGTFDITLSVKIFYGLLSVGKKTVTVNVVEGQTTEVLYKPTWWFILIPGKVEIGGQPVQ